MNQVEFIKFETISESDSEDSEEEETFEKEKNNDDDDDDDGLRHNLKQLRDVATQPETVLHTGVLNAFFAHSYMLKKIYDYD
jgi:hypothetical protein